MLILRGRVFRAATLAAALLGVACAAACTGSASPAVIIVGVTLPLSGPDAGDGDAMRRGYARAIDEINAAGGVLVSHVGRRIPVRLEVHDDGGEARRVEEGVRELVEGGSLALLGTAGPVRTAVEADRAERLGCTLVVNAIDAPGLPGARTEWTVSVPASGDTEARAYGTARVLVDALGRATVIDLLGVRAALAASAATNGGLTRAASLR